MKTNVFLFSILITILLSSLYFSEPGFNGTAPGCEGSGCHDQRVGIVSAVTSGLDVEITVMGSESGEPVAGELVDENGDVVDFINVSNDTTFTLTAPSEGTFLVNGGYKKPDREWDSVSVVIALTGVGGTAEPTIIYKLYSNYPNPFNPSTKIKYTVAEKTFVSLKVYDVSGSEVSSIVNQEQAAGEYEFNFNAATLTSGVYFYTLQAGNFVETNKMRLMK